MIVATVFKSQKPCFVCKKQEKTVQVRSGEVTVPLCLEHMYERLEEKPKKVKGKVAEKKA
jgi:hypothetical protein